MKVTPRHPFPARSTITLELSTRMSPKEVGEFYRKARSGEFFGDELADGMRVLAALPAKRVKPMSDEACELAVFIAEVNDGRRWEDALEEWNQRGSGRKWDSPEEGFVRAAKEAYERVTGQPLAWARGRGQRGATRPSD